MDEPLDRIAFLVNSKNRVRVLQTVAAAPQTRAELAAETEVARATLGRILGDLEDRAWIERRRDEYVATPTGTVPIHGMIDRIDVVPGTDPTQLVVRDYKTGRTPSENDTLAGLAFQLPLYALLAEGVLGDVETVGGAYYQIKPPTGVSHRKGLIGSDAHATWVGSDDVDTPLLRYSTPAFETHDTFRQFIEQTTVTRLGELAAGLESGRFHPTVLDPGDAGCRYCGYRDVCDVRSHRRRDVIDHIDDAGVDTYVPLAARDTDPADVLQVE